MNYEIERDGFAIVSGVLSPDERSKLLSALGLAPKAGHRGLLAEPAVRELARNGAMLGLVRPHVPEAPMPVRAIFFDKSPEANWVVAWHQDLTIEVRARTDLPGFGPWSVKDGVPHVQPPIELMEQMLAVRLHFDDADASNGALRVLPGSHQLGRLSIGRIHELRAQHSEVLCTVSAGDALLMRPLLLHASNRSAKPSHRRVLHIEYAGFQLPPGLVWHEAY